jgi:hypothetical protein
MVEFSVCACMCATVQEVVGDGLVGLSVARADGRVSFSYFMEVFGKGDVTGAKLDEADSETAGQAVNCGQIRVFEECGIVLHCVLVALQRLPFLLHFILELGHEGLSCGRVAPG